MSDPHVHAPKQRRSRRTLQRLTRAALELIAEDGVDGATVQAIVRRAESSVGSFYARFDGKDDLLAYLDERIWEHAGQRWDEAMVAGWGERPIAGIVHGLSRVYGEVESMHRKARAALAQTLRGPGAGPSPAELDFRAKLRDDSRRLLLDRRDSITHPTPDLAVTTTCRCLEACAVSLDPPVAVDLCSALIRHLTGARTSDHTPDDDVEFFDIWG